MAIQPLQGLAKTQLMQVDDQVNGTAAALSSVPVHEPGSGDGEHAPAGVPLVRFVTVGLGATELQQWMRGGGRAAGWCEYVVPVGVARRE